MSLGARLGRAEQLAEQARIEDPAEDIRLAAGFTPTEARAASREADRIARRHALRGCCERAGDRRQRACLEAQHGSLPPDGVDWERRLREARVERKRRRREPGAGPDSGQRVVVRPS